MVAFRRMIAPYWATKCVFRLSAANGESNQESGRLNSVESQCETNAYCGHFQSQRACKAVLWERNPAFESNLLRQPVQPFLSLGGVLLENSILPPKIRNIAWTNVACFV